MGSRICKKGKVPVEGLDQRCSWPLTQCAWSPDLHVSGGALATEGAFASDIMKRFG